MINELGRIGQVWNGEDARALLGFARQLERELTRAEEGYQCYVRNTTNEREKLQSELTVLRAQLDECRREKSESNKLIDTLLHDAKYEGGVQYWIRKHDELLMHLGNALSTLTHATQQSAAAEKRCAELESDAKRLDWLDKNASLAAKYKNAPPASDHEGPLFWRVDWVHGNEETRTLRSAIDAALSASTQQGEGKL